MKVFLGILIISFAIFHEIVVAGRSGGRGGPRFHSNMCCNVEKSERDSASQGEMIGHFKQCADELGLSTYCQRRKLMYNKIEYLKKTEIQFL